MTVLYPNPCYNKLCYEGTALSSLHRPTMKTQKNLHSLIRDFPACTPSTKEQSSLSKAHTQGIIKKI